MSKQFIHDPCRIVTMYRNHTGMHTSYTHARTHARTHTREMEIYILLDRETERVPPNSNHSIYTGLYCFACRLLSLKALSAIGTLISSFTLHVGRVRHVSSSKFMHRQNKSMIVNQLVSGVTGWLSCQSDGLEIQRPRVRIQSGAQEKLVSFSESRFKVVLTCCRCAQPLCVYACI